MPDNYNRVNAWTDPQWEKTHPTEWTDETAKITQGGYNVAAQKRSHRVPRNSLISLETPETPDNYNLQDAWTDDQTDNMDEEEYMAETKKGFHYMGRGGA